MIWEDAGHTDDGKDDLDVGLELDAKVENDVQRAAASVAADSELGLADRAGEREEREGEEREEDAVEARLLHGGDGWGVEDC